MLPRFRLSTCPVLKVVKSSSVRLPTTGVVEVTVLALPQFMNMEFMLVTLVVFSGIMSVESPVQPLNMLAMFRTFAVVDTVAPLASLLSSGDKSILVSDLQPLNMFCM